MMETDVTHESQCSAISTLLNSYAPNSIYSRLVSISCGGGALFSCHLHHTKEMHFRYWRSKIRRMDVRDFAGVLQTADVSMKSSE